MEENNADADEGDSSPHICSHDEDAVKENA